MAVFRTSVPSTGSVRCQALLELAHGGRQPFRRRRAETKKLLLFDLAELIVREFTHLFQNGAETALGLRCGGWSAAAVKVEGTALGLQ